MKNRTFWSEVQIKVLQEKYHNTLAQDIAIEVGRDVKSVYFKANAMGLKKDPEFIRENSKSNYKNNPEFQKFLYYKGHEPANKGQKMPSELYERIKHTFIKKGNTPHNAYKVGYEFTVKDSKGRMYRKIKTSNRRAAFLHRVLWESVNGKIPKGSNVIFKNGDTMDMRIENLECLTNVELMNKNSIVNYPPELRTRISKLAKFNKKLNKIQNG